jgi:hypothetical protein
MLVRIRKKKVFNPHNMCEHTLTLTHLHSHQCMSHVCAWIMCVHSGLWWYYNIIIVTPTSYLLICPWLCNHGDSCTLYTTWTWNVQPFSFQVGFMFTQLCSAWVDMFLPVIPTRKSLLRRFSSYIHVHVLVHVRITCTCSSTWKGRICGTCSGRVRLLSTQAWINDIKVSCMIQICSWWYFRLTCTMYMYPNMGGWGPSYPFSHVCVDSSWTLLEHHTWILCPILSLESSCILIVFIVLLKK